MVAIISSVFVPKHLSFPYLFSDKRQTHCKTMIVFHWMLSLRNCVRVADEYFYYMLNLI